MNTNKKLNRTIRYLPKVVLKPFKPLKPLIPARPLLKTLTPEDHASRKVSTLIEMLTYRRPAGSYTEAAFIHRYIISLGCKPDSYGNYWYNIGESNVLWSSHLDTVHRDEGRQELIVKDDMITVKDSNCLGADCTTGVWIMREMILSKVPGLYCFHREEECGGCGSMHIRNNFDSILSKVQFAIAFDRKGYDSIITHQGMRTASDAFAISIAPLLPATGFCADNTGLFTDTANYADIVPECTNLSIGYFDNHMSTETQDLRFALELREHMLKFDETKLVAARDPNQVDYYKKDLFDNGFDDYYKSYYKSRKNTDWPDYADYKPLTLTELVKKYPDEIADILEQYGYDAEELLREITESQFY